MKYLAGIAIGTTVLALVCSASGTARSQDFPNRPVTITIPFAPGGSAEASLRPLTEWLSKYWKQPVIVENRAGGGTTIAAAYMAEQKPDGYRLYFTPVASHTISASLFSALKYDPVKSFTPISGAATSPYVVMVNPSSPAKTIKDLIANAKANPGKINYGSSGAGTGPHLAGEILKQSVGMNTVHVSFRGAAPAITALLGNHVDYLVTDISALSLIEAGQLRALAVTSRERSPFLPETPTLSVTVAPGFVATNRRGLIGPGGMDPKLAAAITDAIHKALATEDVQKAYAPLGYTASPLSSEQLGQMMKSDFERFGQVIRQVGVKAE